MKYPIMLAIFFVLTAILPAHAEDMDTHFNAVAVCPIDGKSFLSNVSRMLDMKPGGYGANNKMFPECPHDGFILYTRFFDHEVQRMKSYIMSAEYQAMRETETQSWRIAKIVEDRLEPLEVLALWQLRATWEANAEQYPRYAKAAILSHIEIMQEWEKIAGDYTDTVHRLLIIEFYRRLGEFDAARTMIFETKKGIDNSSNSAFLSVLNQQLMLLDKKNSEPQFFNPVIDASN